MLRIRTIGVHLAVVAASVAAVSSAEAALPEWQKKGEALKEALPFTITGGPGSFENAAGTTKVTWTSVSGKGTIEGTKQIIKLSIIFWGSKAKEGTEKECEVKSPKAKEGEIVTKELKGLIGYLNKEEKKVGALFEPVTGTAVAEVEGKCLKAKLLVLGSVVGKVTSALNKEVGSVQLSFAAGGKKQEFVKLEGEGKEHTLLFGEPGEGALFECKEENLHLNEGRTVELKA